jgi:homoserine O-acetyltransferase
MNKIHIHTFPQPFVTESGHSIPEPTVAYLTWGRLNRTYDNAVLVCHALTGNTAADEWFGGLLGPGRLLDPEKHFIVCPNVLGSCYGTTGPTSTNPETGKPYRADFPVVTIRDMVRMHQRLLDELSIRAVELVVGGSMGGMQALEFAIMDPRAGAAVVMGMGKAHSPWTIGISHTQRQAIYNDPDWNNGYYSNEHPPRKGLALARMIAMNSYRSPADFERKFGRKPQPDSEIFQVESYLNYQGRKIVDRFDAVSYVRLTQAMDSHDVARYRPGYKEVLNSVRIPVLVVGIDSDWLYPVNEQKELASLLPLGSYAEIHSPYGHDAFLIEFDQIHRLYSTFFKKYLKSEAI